MPESNTVWTSWRKSSYSGNDGNGDCVEIGWKAEADRVGIRDSKNITGPALAFGPRIWRGFLTAVR